MSNPSTYNFNGHQIRTITDMDGVMWWGLKDLVRALKLDEVATGWWLRLECSEKDNKSFLGPDGRQYLRVVNRYGVRHLLESSPVSEDFKRWAAGVFRKKNHHSPLGNGKKIPAADNGLLTPTRIGKEVGGISAQQVNQLLVNLGMQRPVMDFDKKRYLLTDVGRVMGVTTAVRKNNEEEVSSVMWRPEIVNLVSARLRAEKREKLHG